MSVRANRSVASSILEFRLCPKRVLFGFGGEQAKRGTRESTHKKGAKGDIQKLAKEKQRPPLPHKNGEEHKYSCSVDRGFSLCSFFV